MVIHRVTNRYYYHYHPQRLYYLNPSGVYLFLKMNISKAHANYKFVESLRVMEGLCTV